jgi:hypothetical protein
MHRLASQIVRCAPVVAFASASLLAASPARATADVPDPDLTREAQPAQSGPVNLLPEAMAARVTSDRAVASSWVGYDGARRAPLMSVEVDARIVGHVALVAGAAYSADLPGTRQLRPVLGLQAQVLDQAHAGVDGAVAVAYRKDIFSNEGGFFQGGVAIERRQGRAHVVGNLIYGQDGEGDDRQGEARLAAMVRAHGGLEVGVDGRYRHLWSTDPNQATRDRPTSEVMAGPTASYTHGSWAVMAETGVSAIRTNVTQSGVIALAGVGSTF